MSDFLQLGIYYDHGKGKSLDIESYLKDMGCAYFGQNTAVFYVLAHLAVDIFISLATCL